MATAEKKEDEVRKLRLKMWRLLREWKLTLRSKSASVAGIVVLLNEKTKDWKWVFLFVNCGKMGIRENECINVVCDDRSDGTAVPVV